MIEIICVNSVLALKSLLEGMRMQTSTKYFYFGFINIQQKINFSVQINSIPALVFINFEQIHI